MSELVGDICRPSELILPTGTQPTISGQILISGATLLWYDGSGVQTLSGSNTGD